MSLHLSWPIGCARTWPGRELNTIYPITAYLGFQVLQIVTIMATLFYYRQYYIPRAVSRVDQIYYVIAAVTIGTLIALALSTLLFKDNDAIANFPRAMVVYSWLLAIIFIVIGRMLHQTVRHWLRDRGMGKDRLLVVGTGDTARFMLQRILWSPQLGYELVGVINGDSEETEFLGVPILGTPEDLPDLIEELAIDEVIVAIPRRVTGKRFRVISYCERGRVTVKVFPDIFQFVTSQATIDDLGVCRCSQCVISLYGAIC